MIYQIKDWDQHFENDRSRRRDKCSFVCVPNKQHGMGFCRIMAEPDGAAIYGIWICIVAACSQQPSRHGWLTADGDSEGTPWGPDDLSLKFRRPESEITRALQVLSSDKVAWLITHKSPSSHPLLTDESPPSTLKEEKRKERIEGKEGKENGNASLPASALIEEVFNSWNELATVPQCLVISDKRRQQLLRRLKEPFFFTNWRTAMSKISKSRFCQGQNDRGWKATFDWFITPDVVAKVVEGKYDDCGKKAENGQLQEHIEVKSL